MALTNIPPQIAAVTLCVPILVIIAIAGMFGMGSSSVIVRLRVRGKTEADTGYFNFSLYSIILRGIIVLVLGVFIKLLASIIGADATNIGYTSDYL